VLVDLIYIKGARRGVTYIEGEGEKIIEVD